MPCHHHHDVRTSALQWRHPGSLLVSVYIVNRPPLPLRLHCRAPPVYSIFSLPPTPPRCCPQCWWWGCWPPSPPVTGSWWCRLHGLRSRGSPVRIVQYSFALHTSRHPDVMFAGAQDCPRRRGARTWVWAPPPACGSPTTPSCRASPACPRT